MERAENIKNKNMQMMIPSVWYSIAASCIVLRSLRSQGHTTETRIAITVLLEVHAITSSQLF
jgi:hypothetical protein